MRDDQSPAEYTNSSTNVPIVTLVNDNDIPTGTGQVVTFTNTSPTFAEDAGTVTLDLEVEEDAAADIEVTLVTSVVGTGIGFATSAAPTDFTAITALTTTTNTATIAMGSKTATISIDIEEDTVPEPNETFVVEIYSVTGGTFTATDSKAVVTITDNDTAPVITVDSNAAAAIDEGTDVVFTYTATVASERDVNIQVELEKTSGDFFLEDQELSKVVVLPAGATTVTDTIETDNDRIFEGNGSFTLTVLADVSTNTPAHYTLGGDIEEVVSVNDNEVAPEIHVSIPTGQDIEEGGEFEIQVDIVADATETSSMTAATQFEVNYTITDHATIDFIATADETSTISIPAGETMATKTIDIADTTENTIHGDGGDIMVVIADDTAPIVYTKASDAANNSATVSIEDNDKPPVIALSLPADQTIAEGGAVMIKADIITDETNLTTGSVAAIDVHYNVIDSNANFIADANELEAARVIPIPLGDATATKSINIEQNTIDREASEVTIALADDSESDTTYVKSEYRFQNQVKFNVVDDDEPPVVKLTLPTGQTIAEGGTFMIRAEIVVDQTNTTDASGEDIKVHYRITDSKFDDFIADAEQVSFITIVAGDGDGIEAKTISVQQNFIDNDDGEITISLEDDGLITLYTKSATPADNALTVEIDDDDDAPFIQASLVNATGTEEGTEAIRFSVSDEGATSTTTASAQDIEIQVSISETTGDYFAFDLNTPTTQTVTLPAGETTVDGIVPNDDLIDEVDGTFTVDLQANSSDDTMYSVSATNPQLTANVTDNDAGPIIEIVRSPNPAIAEGATDGTNPEGAEYTLQIAPNDSNPTTASTQAFSVAIAVAEVGSGDFFDPLPTPSVDFAAEETTKTFEVIPTDDGDSEAHGSFTVTISEDSNTTALYSVSSINNSITTSVNDDESVTAQSPTLKFASPTATVTETATETLVTLTVELTGTATENNDITVNYITQKTGDGTGHAVAGSDFTAPVTTNDANTVTFTYAESNPETTQTIQIPILVDTIIEPNETFKVVLVNPVNASLETGEGENEATVTISDDDTTPPVVELSLPDNQTITEGGEFMIQVSIPAEQTGSTGSTNDIIVGYTITDDTSTDFIATADESSNITIKGGSTSATKVISIQDNTIDRDAGSIMIALADDTNATALYTVSTDADKNSIAVEIADDDAVPVIDISLPEDQLLVEGESFIIQVDIVVDETNTTTASTEPIEVHYSFQDTVADFISANNELATATSITIPANASTAQKTIELQNNDIDADGGTVTIVLDNDDATDIKYTAFQVAGQSGQQTNDFVAVEVKDNDEPPVIELSLVAGQTIREDGGFTIQVDIDDVNYTTEGSAQEIEVHYTITDSTDADFIATGDETSMVPIDVRETSATKTINFQNSADNTIDRDEYSITVSLADDAANEIKYLKSGAMNEVNVMIEDNDAPPVVKLVPVASQPVPEDGELEIRVEIVTSGTNTTTLSDEEILVRYQITDSELADFIAEEDQISTISIAKGQPSGSITIDIEDNSIDRDDDSIEIALLDDRGDILYMKSREANENKISVDIADNDDAPVIQASRDVSTPITEEDSAEIVFSIVTDDINTTKMSARDIEIRVGIVEDEGDYFTPDPTPSTPIVVTLPAGETSVSGVSPTNDTVDEADGSFTATLMEDDSTVNTPVHYNVAAENSGISVDVTDDDDAPNIEVVRDPNPAIDEGGDARYTFRIAPSKEYPTTLSDQDIEIAVTLSDSGGDFIDDENATKSVTISAGTTSKDDTISTVDNRFVESHGSITVTIEDDDGTTSNGRYNVSSENNSVVTSVNENDLRNHNASLKFTMATLEITEEDADGMIELEVELESSTATSDITVMYATQVISDGLGYAAPDQDFTAPIDGSNVITFAYSATDPVTTQMIQIPILADLIDEPDESFRVILLSPNGAPLSTEARENEVTISIMDNDAPPVIQVSSASSAAINEGDTATFTYSIVTDATNTTESSARDIKIQVLESDENGVYLDQTIDHMVAIPVMLSAGSTSVDREINIPNNTIDEIGGTITAEIQDDDGNDPAHYVVSSTNNELAINVNDDDNPPLIQFSRSSEEGIVEGENADIVFSIVNDDNNTTTASAHPVNIRVDVTETGGEYFGVTEDSSIVEVTLPALASSVNGLNPVDDTIDEDDGMFTADLVEDDPANTNTLYTIGSSNETVMVEVFDNDAPPVIEMYRAVSRAITEGESANIRFSIYTNEQNGVTTTASTRDIDIRVDIDQMYNGGADGDFIAEVPSTVTLVAGDTSVNAIPTEDDFVDELDGTIEVELLADSGVNDPAYYTIGAPDARTANVMVDVKDNDALPVIQMSQVNTGEPINEGDEDIMMFSIFTDPANDITTESSTQNIDIRVGIKEDSGDYFNPDPDPMMPMTVTLMAGETSVLGVTPTDDFIDEDNGSFTVTLLEDDDNEETDPMDYAVVENNQEIPINIEDDDAPPVIEFSRTDTGTINEGEDANIVFSIYTDATNTTESSARDIEIRLGITEDTGDYFNPDPDPNDPRTITLMAGQTSVAGVNPTDDTIDEADGTFTVTVLADDTANSTAHYTIGATGANNDPVTVNVTDNDDAPAIHVRKTPDSVIQEGEMASLQFFIYTDGTYTTTQSEYEIEFPVVITDTSTVVMIPDGSGGMEASGTYLTTSPLTPMVTLAANATTVDETFSFEIDNVDEPDGRFTVVVTDDSSTGSDRRYTSLIATADTAETFRVRDDDDAPVIQVVRSGTNAADDIMEGGEVAARTAQYTYSIHTDDTAGVTTTKSVRQIDILVGVTQENGLYDLTIGSDSFNIKDNVDTPRTITLMPGVTTIDDTVIVDENTTDEIDGSITVTILPDTDTHTDPHYAVGDNSSVQVQIVDNDDAPYIMAELIEATGIAEGQAAVRFSVSDEAGTETTTASGHDIALQVKITEKTGNYFGIAADASPKEVTQFVTLEAGQTSVTGIVPLDDTIDEVDGTFDALLEVSTDNATHYKVASGTAALDAIVTDNDNPPVIHPVIQPYTEGDTTVSFATYRDEFGQFTTTASDIDVTFMVNIVETSTEGASYITTDISSAIPVTLSAGARSVTANITFEDDRIDEIHGSFTVSIPDFVGTGQDPRIEFTSMSASSPVSLVIEDNDIPPLVTIERTTGETNPIMEGDQPTFMIGILEVAGEYPTTASAHDINVRVGIQESDDDFFDPDPEMEVTIPKNTTTPVTLTLTTSNDTIDEDNGSFTAVILDDSNEEGDATYQSRSDDNSVEVMVTDDDDAPVIQVRDNLTKITEGEDAVIVYEIFTDTDFTTTGSAHDIDISVEVQVDNQLSNLEPGQDAHNNYFGPNFVTARTLRLPAGHDTVIDVVKTVDDEVDETDGQFTVEIQDDPSGNDRYSSIAQTDDDPPIDLSNQSQEIMVEDNDVPKLSIASTYNLEGNVGSREQLTFVVTSDTASTQTIDVTRNVVFTTNATNNANVGDFLRDERTNFQTLKIRGDGTLSERGTETAFYIPIRPDSVAEGHETFMVKLTNPTNGAEFAPNGDTATGTILNDDSFPTLTFVDGESISVLEGDYTLNLGISLDADPAIVVEGEISTVEGTATASTVQSTSDFEPGDSAEFTIIPGPDYSNTTGIIPIKINDDDVYEGNETFEVVLSQLAGVDNPTTPVRISVTIVDDEAPAVLSVVSGSDMDSPPSRIEKLIKVSESAGSAIIDLSLSQVGESPVSVFYSTADGTAANKIATGGTGTPVNYDYEARSDVEYTIPNLTTGVIEIPINDDLVDEDDEEFKVTFTNPTNATFGSSIQSIVVTIVIVDDDGLPRLSFVNREVNVLESESEVVLNVELSEPADPLKPASFTWKTVDGATDDRAVAGYDFIGTTRPQNVTISGTSATITVSLIPNSIDIARNRVFGVKIPTVTNAEFERGFENLTADVIIWDDESIPTFSVFAVGGQATRHECGPRPVDEVSNLEANSELLEGKTELGAKGCQPEGSEVQFRVVASEAPAGNTPIRLTLSQDGDLIMVSGNTSKSLNLGENVVTFPAGETEMTFVVQTKKNRISSGSNDYSQWATPAADGSITATLIAPANNALDNYDVNANADSAEVVIFDTDLPRVAIEAVSLSGINASEVAEFKVTAQPTTIESLIVNVDLMQVTTGNDDFLVANPGLRTVMLTPKMNNSGGVVEVSGILREPTKVDADAVADGSLVASIDPSSRYNAVLDQNLSSATLMIRNNDGTPSDLPIISIAPTSSVPVTEGGTAEFTLTASETSSTAYTIDVGLRSVSGDFIDISTEDDAPATIFATGGYVYSTQVELPAEQTSISISVPTVNDMVDENDGEIVAWVIIGSDSSYQVRKDQTATERPLVGAELEMGSSVASVAILDNDAVPVIAIAKYPNSLTSVAEGVSAEFEITASHLSQEPKTILVDYSDGESDFISTSTLNQIILPGGSLTARYFVHTIDDEIDETDGTISVTLIGDPTLPITYSIATNQDDTNNTDDDNTVTISVTDNDNIRPVRPEPIPEISVVARQQIVDEFSGALWFNFASSITLTRSIPVTVVLTQGEGENFTVSPTPREVQVRFEAGENESELEVRLADDTTVEESGTITVTISEDSDYTVSATSASASVMILDDDRSDRIPVIAIEAKAPATVTEGPTSAPTNAVFNITSTESIATPGVMVHLQVSDGDGDFISNPPDSITLSDVSANQKVELEIPIVADDIEEDHGEITVTLLEDLPENETDVVTYTVNSVASKNTAKVTVYDDDAKPIIGLLSATESHTATITEGQPVIIRAVDIRSANGTEVDETISVNVEIEQVGEFLLNPVETGEITILAGEIQGELALATHDDIFMEAASGTVTARILPGKGYQIPPSAPPAQAAYRTLVITVQNDNVDTVLPDSIPTLSVAAATSSENGVAEDATADFVITAEGTVGTGLMVRVSIEDGVHNFLGTNVGEVMFPSGNTEHPHSVMLHDDDVYELAGEVTLTLLPDDALTPTYAVAARPKNSASVTVTDNEALPAIRLANVTIGSPPNLDTVVEGTSVVFGLIASHESALIVNGVSSPLPVNLSFGGDINDFVGFGTTLPTTGYIPSGGRESSINVVTENDLLNEANGEIFVTVAPGENYVVGTTSTASLKIADNDDPIVTIAAGPSITEGDVANFEIDMIPAPEEAMMVYVDVTQTGNFIEIAENSKPQAVEIGTNGSGQLMVQTTADDQDEFDGTVIATLRADQAQEVRYLIPTSEQSQAQEKGYVYVLDSLSNQLPLRNFSEKLDNSVFVAVADDDDDVTRVAISTSDIVVDERSNPAGTFEFVLTADPTPESYAPLDIELAVNDPIGYFKEFLPGTIQITKANNPLTVTVVIDDDEVDEDDGIIKISVVDTADYVGAEQQITPTHENNTIAVRVRDNDVNVPVVSIAASESSVDEGDAFEFTVTTSERPDSGELQEIVLEVSEEVEANNFYELVEFSNDGGTNYTSGLLEDRNDPNTVTIYVGDTGTVAARVQTEDDDAYQFDSDITVAVKTLTNSDGEVIYRAAHAPNNAVTFEVNNNDDPVIAVSNFSVLEGGEDSEYNLVLNLETVSAEDVMVEYEVADGEGDATVEDDYELVGSEPEKTLSVMIESGEQAAQIPISIKADSEDDATETFVLNLTATNAEFANGGTTTKVTGTIVEMPVVSITSTQSMVADKEEYYFTVSAAPLAENLTVVLNVVDAVENIIIPAQEGERMINLTPSASSSSDKVVFKTDINDLYTAMEAKVVVEITENTNYIVDSNNSEVMVTVVNSETLPVVSITGDGDIIEGNDAVFTVSVEDQRDVNYVEIPRTQNLVVKVMAMGGTDNFIDGVIEDTITITPSEDEVKFKVPTLQDDEIQPDNNGYVDTVTAVLQPGTMFRLEESSNDEVPPASATVNILDNADFPIITFSTETATVDEDEVIRYPFAVTNLPTDGSYEEIVVSFAVKTDTSTAIEGDDFNIFQTSPITLAEGTTVERIIVRTIDDQRFEASDEIFEIEVTAMNAVFAEGATSVILQGTIQDINAGLRPVITVSDATFPEDIGSRTPADTSDDELTFAVTLDRPSNEDVTFYVESIDITASEDSDYTPIVDTCYTNIIEPECFTYESRPRGGKFVIPAGETDVVYAVDPENSETTVRMGGVNLLGDPITGLTIPIADDNDRERRNELFRLRFTNPRYATFAGDAEVLTAIGTIQDDENRVISFALDNYDVEEGYDSNPSTPLPEEQPDYITVVSSEVTNVTLTVNSSVPAVEPIALTYVVGAEGDTAIAAVDPDSVVAGEDYNRTGATTAPDPLVIESNTDSSTITIPIFFPNVIDEPDEFFKVVITEIEPRVPLAEKKAIFSGNRPAETTVTIKDTDSTAANLPRLSFVDGDVHDINEDVGTEQNIVVRLSESPSLAVSFDVTITGGTEPGQATSGTNEDFTATATTTERKTIAANATGAALDVNIPVTIRDDSDNEGNETFVVTLSNLDKALFIGDPAPAELTQTVTIVDDEKPTLTFSQTATLNDVDEISSITTARTEAKEFRVPEADSTIDLTFKLVRDFKIGS